MSLQLIINQSGNNYNQSQKDAILATLDLLVTNAIESNDRITIETLHRLLTRNLRKDESYPLVQRLDRKLSLMGNAPIDPHYIGEAKARETGTSFCGNPARADEIIRKIAEYQQGATTPKAKAKPVRAAMEAGAIDRPTFGQYDGLVQEGILQRIDKSSFSNYTNPDNHPYADKGFNSMIDEFEKLI